ncbi:MAG: transglycosylase SLT domain-containing protein [Bdellovibrionales bacterium]|nr:transglycosylase SLT domain-containing protein [Bdellovibrionales bacterium]
MLPVVGLLPESLGEDQVREPTSAEAQALADALGPIRTADEWERRELRREGLPETVPLSEVVNGVATGLDQLKRDTPEWRRLWERTRMLVGYRAKTLSSKEMSELVGDCIIRPERTPQCHFLTQEWVRDWGKNVPSFLPLEDSPRRIPPEGMTADADPADDADEPAESGPGRAPASVRSNAAALKRSQIVGALQDGDLDALEGLTNVQIYRALDEFSTWQPLRSTVTRVLRGSCPRLPLLVALGMKAEEYFPDADALEASRSLFQRAHECGGPRDEQAAKARYRLALIHVWRGECSEADPLWTNLAVQPGGLYISRANYWLGNCADRRGNRIRAQVLKNRLLKENPIGFHTLVVHQGVSGPVRGLVYGNDPQVRFRSLARPDLNPVMLTLELLLGSGAESVAQELVRFLRDQATGAEPEFQLYLAVLALRAGDRITQFKILADLFRDSPQLLSAGTLKLFYPLKRYATLWNYKEWVSPYLSLALIRQESAFNEGARSRVGALGLMQLMPDTARTMARVNTRQLLDPQTNLKLGVRFFRKLLDRYKGDAELALAAYNAGPERVDSWLKRYPTDDRVLFLDLIPFAETRNYVALITRNYLWYLTLYAPELLERGKVPGGRSPASQGPAPGVLAAAGAGVRFRTIDRF